ncbi:MAG: hypothetical protein PHP53_10860 [Prolixibacteraceae bacterium]|nr:hypothetical protein [Prolixibacteraceae bacterium]
MKNIFIVLLAFWGLNSFAQAKKLIWEIAPDKSIVWQVQKGQVHTDHIEMSGLQISSIITYGVNEKGLLSLKKKLVFPMLRTIPNDTHASLIKTFDEIQQPVIVANGDTVREYPAEFQHKGLITVRSKTNTPLEITRKLFPSVNKAAFIEQFQLVNTSGKACNVALSFIPVVSKTEASKGVYGEYTVEANCSKTGKFVLEPSGKLSFAVVYTGRKPGEEKYQYSSAYELLKREKFVQEVFGNLVLETPNDTINEEFAFAKIRATESIYDTKGGLMHGPGGGAYYAAIWANDQAEYVNPFFPYLGNLEGNESAINSYRHFARFMNPEYKPIPSSIVAEGVDFWNGAGDRGDQAMIAYGASRFSLTYGNEEVARELWPLVRWCLEYLERKKDANGIIGSDSDELEGRFPAGKFNLSTNSLAYGALISSANLATELGKPDTAKIYLERAFKLKQAIENYFGANVQGFDTYRYFDGNDKLRAWICIPLTMGIFDRKDETIKALFSPLLWTENGILTESGSKTFWDRSTLYAFRGMFVGEATDKAMPYFNYYSSHRLLGDHVPYPVEAWPEGNQRHLSAESGLYCRTITEGLFGFTPTGFNKFKITPWLPKGWDYMNLRNIHAFGKCFDLEVKRKGNSELIMVKVDGNEILQKIWDKKGELEITL